jgi:phosphoglycerate dehydrogenase-like enzyme
MNLIITFYVDEKERYIYEEAFKGKAEVIFLKDIKKPDRAKELEKAEIIFAWNPLNEFAGLGTNGFKKLRFIQLLSAGYDHLDFSLLPRNCIIAANQGAYSNQMAEHAISMILALSKRLLINHGKMMHGEFDQKTDNRLLSNSSVGIIGFGGIGKAIAEMLKNFGVKIFAINTSGITDKPIEFIGTLADLDFVLSKSDVLILSIPLNDITTGLIGKRELELMKPDAILINIARGDLIVEKDLFEHLRNNTGFTAGIDAWWIEPFKYGEFKLNFPFLNLPNVLGSPHNSALIPGALFEGQKRAVENIVNFIENKPVRGIVNRI